MTEPCSCRIFQLPRLRSPPERKLGEGALWQQITGHWKFSKICRGSRNNSEAETAQLQLPLGRSFQDSGFEMLCTVSRVSRQAPHTGHHKTAAVQEQRESERRARLAELNRRFAAAQEAAKAPLFRDVPSSSPAPKCLVARCHCQGLLLSSDEKLQLYAYQKQARFQCLRCPLSRRQDGDGGNRRPRFWKSARPLERDCPLKVGCLGEIEAWQSSDHMQSVAQAFVRFAKCGLLSFLSIDSF